MNALARLIPDFDAPDGAAVPAATLLSFAEGVEKPDRGIDLADVEARAEARARAAARAEADVECARLRAEDRARFDEELAEHRRSWAETEGEQLARQVTEAVTNLEVRIADTAARAIGPFLALPLRTKALSELGTTILSLIADREHPTLQISGPQDLLDQLRAHLGDSAAAISFQVGETTDVRVTANSTVIETQLRAWLDRLAEAVN